MIFDGRSWLKSLRSEGTPKTRLPLSVVVDNPQRRDSVYLAALTEIPYWANGIDPINISHSSHISSLILGRARDLACKTLIANSSALDRRSVLFSCFSELNIIKTVSACQQLFFSEARRNSPDQTIDGSECSEPRRQDKRMLTRRARVLLNPKY